MAVSVVVVYENCTISKHKKKKISKNKIGRETMTLGDVNH